MVEDNTTDINNSCKGLISLNIDLQNISNCIENHIQILNENTNKIESEFNKINEKIGSDGNFFIGDNILTSLSEIKRSNDIIKNVFLGLNEPVDKYKNHPWFNGKLVKSFEGIFILFLQIFPALLLLLFIVYQIFSENDSLGFLIFFRDFIDKYFLVYTSVIIGLLFSRYFDLLINHDYNNLYIKKARKYSLVSILIFYIFYMGIGFGSYYFINSEIDKINKISEKK